jgi:transposase-like protein
MTSTNGVEEVLEQDARGRVRVSRERRDAMLEEFARSGMNATRFARLAGINYQTFAGWVRRRKLSRGEEAESAVPSTMVGGTVRLFEAVLREERSSGSMGALRVDLPGGSRLFIESPTHLAMAAELIRLLAQGGRR